MIQKENAVPGHAVDPGALDELVELVRELDGAERCLAAAIGAELSGRDLMERAKLDLERLARGDFDRLLETRLFKQYVRVKDLRDEVTIGTEELRPAELGRAVDFIVAGAELSGFEDDSPEEIFRGRPATLAAQLTEDPSLRAAFAIGHDVLSGWGKVPSHSARRAGRVAAVASAAAALGALAAAAAFICCNRSRARLPLRR